MVRVYLQGYSDPEGFKSERDGTRFDNLDMMAIMARPFARSDAVMRAVQQPNRTAQVIHDTSFPQKVWWTEPMTEARSFLFGCVGHAILGTGAGKGNMAQASLHFGGTHGHEHLDCLNLILFAKGRELISETRYRPYDIPNTSRAWHVATAGHATVVVDETNQNSRGSKDCFRRAREPADAVPGIPDWPWRWRGHGNCMNDGMLRLFNTDFEKVQVVEADGERSYGTTLALKQYRRTVALVKITESDVYVVDVFRVRGGEVHDYMLHSCLELNHTLTLEPEVTEAKPGKLHKYIDQLRSRKTDGPWTATFAMEDASCSLKTFMMPQPGTEIIVGEGPAMRRRGTAPFIAVRHTGGGERVRGRASSFHGAAAGEQGRTAGGPTRGWRGGRARHLDDRAAGCGGLHG